MRIDPYGPAARWYDVASGERLVYRAGRLAGLRLLRPRRGDAVVDLGCGTGLNLPLLARAVGPEGLLVGLDRSPHMLAVAARRPGRGWPGVHLVEADATRPPLDRVAEVLRAAGRPAGADAVIATYSLSVTDDWRAAWAGATALLRPGGRAAVVDMRLPAGPARPFAALAMRLGGADPDAAPWRPLAEAADARRVVLRAGHVVAVAGTPA
ncbi:class I SAM-dependent methyltransferase [Amnibacterium endophyticum]|uniref:Class I SAM-dependent methyltransferase n=1 Tax=Amnibacterium endophyticum TaxID=2109337 RepID=A0ABW4LGZ5_9MICO